MTQFLNREWFDVVGMRLFNLRLDAKLSQQNLADLSGVSVCTIGRAESGSRGLKAEHLFKIAKTLGVTMDSFFEGLEP